jgi:hypothetical protein
MKLEFVSTGLRRSGKGLSADYADSTDFLGERSWDTPRPAANRVVNRPKSVAFTSGLEICTTKVQIVVFSARFSCSHFGKLLDISTAGG